MKVNEILIWRKVTQIFLTWKFKNYEGIMTYVNIWRIIVKEFAVTYKIIKYIELYNNVNLLTIYNVNYTA